MDTAIQLSSLEEQIESIAIQADGKIYAYKKARALTLKAFHDATYEKIAEEMGIKKENVGGIVAQARRDLLHKSPWIKEEYLSRFYSVDYYKPVEKTVISLVQREKLVIS